MRIRQVSTNCSFGLSFEEFEEKILCSSFNVFFDEEYTSFGLYTLTGEAVERFDLFFDDAREKEEFIRFVDEDDDEDF